MPRYVALLIVFVLFAPVLHAEDIALEEVHPEALAAQESGGASDVPALIQDTTLSSNDLWQRIRNGYAMRDLDSPLIARHEQWYANRPDYVARMTERAQRYLHFIVEEVEKRGMPTEIALLPMIESAFNPGAYSVGRASGIWQFIPSTGKNFGMQQNWWYDGRRDVVSATNGALDYLQKLHGMFGDWELALAAYNWGEGAVGRAIEHNRKRGLPTDYAHLKMPDETRNYLPKLFAVRNIVSNPAKFNLTLQSIANEPYFASVSTDKHIDMKLAAELADVSLDEFKALNPAHNRPVILQHSADVLLLPVDKVATFRSNLEANDKPLVSWQAYQSHKGERLDKLAPRFGLSLEKLRAVNSLSARAKISNGQTLLVPIGSEATENNDTEFEAFNTHLVPSEPAIARGIKHTVRKGESLASIARRYHVSPAKLKTWNSELGSLKVGQTLTIVQTTTGRKLLARSGSRSQLASVRGGKKQLARLKKTTRAKLASARTGKKYAARKARRVAVAYNR